MSYSIQEAPVGVGATEYVFFAGDQVQLAGQIDYPATPKPFRGYPIIFIIQHATCNSRNGYAHFARLGTEMGAAVFRWDKRGTGKSGSSGGGSGTLDALNAYKTAVSQPNVDRTRAVIIAQNEGTLLLHDAWVAFKDVCNPLGVVLAGNMLDETEIQRLDVPVTSVMSKSDWNDWKIYGQQATASHYKRYPQYPQSFYTAANSNRRLMLERGGVFHGGAAQFIREWLAVTCKISS